MGNDYVPFALKEGVSEAELEPWVSKQAVTFQSMPYFWATREDWERSEELDELLVGLHEDACLRASEEISKRIEKTQDSYRIKVVTSNLSFPISVRINSMTTILPSQLPKFADTWAKCAETAKFGPWSGRTINWVNQIEWFDKFALWLADKQEAGLGLYLCW